MHSTMPNAELRRNGETLVDDAVGGAERLRDATRTEVGKLAADVEELVKKLANVTDSEVAQLRDKVQRTLKATRRSLGGRSGRIRSGGRRVISAADTYVHQRPWTALGIAAAAAVVIGALSIRRH